MGNVFIGLNSMVESCIIDDGVSVGPFCQIGARNNFPSFIDGIRILGRDTVVPPHTTLGDNQAEWLDIQTVSSPVNLPLLPVR